MLVIAMETGPPRDTRPGWAGRRHDDDRSGATAGSAAAGLFDAVFRALHDGEQVALGLDCPLTRPASPDQSADSPEPSELSELAHLLAELNTWRPWTTVSTSLARWKANTSILLWQAVPAVPARPEEFSAAAAADSFFREFPAALRRAERPARERPAAEPSAGLVVNLAAATVRRSGLFIDPSELTRPVLSITVIPDAPGLAPAQ